MDMRTKEAGVIGKAGKITLALFVILLLAVLIAGGLFWWRLGQGPMRLSFLDDRVRAAIDARLEGTGLGVRMSGVVLERDRQTGKPALRLQNLRLVDSSGRILAHAPRASLGLKFSEVLRGDARVHSVELIGPRIILRRTARGKLEMGFDAASGKQGKQGKLPRGKGGGEANSPFSAGQLFSNEELLNFLNTQIFNPEGKEGALGTLDVIYISRASISYYDELNDVLWYAPHANLVFRRMGYGHALFVSASISNGGRPWRAQFNATFRRKARNFTLAARVSDVIPAQFARNIFALSRLAHISVPLTGHVEATYSAEGELLKASAELTAGSGKVDFPGYIARPVQIKEGLIRVDYDHARGDFVIAPSTVFMNGGAAEIRGRVSPRRDGNGRIRALGLHLELSRGDIRTPPRKGELMIDHLMLDGEARLDAARLDVKDLQIRAGKSAIRAQGYFAGEKEGVGIYLGGRVSNLTLRLVKKLWPPVLAPGARQWIRDNVRTSLIPRGTFQLGIPAKVMQDAIKRDIPVPDRMADIRFSLTGTSFTYYDGLPPIERAAGQARMSGNHFTLRASKGQTRLPNGHTLRLVSGVLKMSELARKVSPLTIQVDAAGQARDFSELLDMKPLRLLSEAGFGKDQLQGSARVRMSFSMPASRHMKASSITVAAQAEIENVILRDVIKGLDLDGGKLRLVYGKRKLAASGNVRLGGLPARLQWSRDFARGKSSDLIVSATLSDKRRKELGIDLSALLTGPLPVTMTARITDGSIRKATLKADLSRATLRLAAIDWLRPPMKGTRATIEVDLSGKDRILLPRIDVRGKDLRITGKLTLDGKGNLREASFPRFELNAMNRLALGLKRTRGRMEVLAAGDSFDARPFISNFFSTRPAARADKEAAFSGPVVINVNLRKVYAQRGEAFYNVRGRLEAIGSFVTRAALTGVTSTGKPVSLDIVPAASGLRRLRLVSRDAGSVLRASGLYSKVYGGRLDFTALLAPSASGGVKKGLLVIKKFQVRNEQKLDKIASKGGKRRTGPRRGLKFRKLTVPFSTDANFIRIGNALVRGDEIGASANGLFRKADGAMDIGGTIIPAYALNAAIGHVPILGQILTGGKGQGVFGLTFALRGTIHKPKFIINPASAIAPGILRNLFVVGGHNVNPDGTRKRPAAPPRRRSRSNVTGG